MKYIIVTVLLVLSSSLIKAQTLTLDSIISLPNQIEESSGLIYFNGKLITHTDSGGENALYEIDTNTAQILRTVYIKNNINKDWEDICDDENFIYLADFGNNAGNRTDLKILKIAKTDFLTVDSVSADIINFSYEDQTDFTSANQNTNFDAEAIISFEDSLYIFTKNWINEETNVYQLSKDSGTYIAKKIASYNVEGLVTGADYNENTNQIFLIGYRKFGSPFAVSLQQFSGNHFFNGLVERYSVELDGSVQVEAICSASKNKYFVSSESFLSLNPMLHQFNSEMNIINAIYVERVETIYTANPNPTKNKVCVNQDFNYGVLFNEKGQFIKIIKEKCINLTEQNSGVYFLKLILIQNEAKYIKIVKQ